MDVIIKGMKIPKACYECRLYEADIYYCSAAERDIDIPSSDEGRCSFCPIIELPDHGDLVDIDAMLDDFAELRDYDFASREYVVIPAERGEDND